MCLNLAIDQGNSGAKLFLFNNKKLIQELRSDNLTPDEISNFVGDREIAAAIRSSVIDNESGLTRFLTGKFPRFIELTAETRMPMSIAYLSKATLGHDRIAAAVGAIETGGENTKVIIDAGTAITLDVVDKSRQFIGGNIAPGLGMRFKALNAYTKRLPLVTPSGDNPIVGYDTTTAIRSGVLNGMLYEIETFVQRVAQKYGSPEVFITGGDAELISLHLNVEATTDKHLLAKGLNRILLHNESK